MWCRHSEIRSVKRRDILPIRLVAAIGHIKLKNITDSHLAMHVVATEKVSGGKLVRIKMDVDEVINSIQITGDFFCHPEHTVELIEAALVGLHVHDGLMKEKIEKALDGAQLIGATADDFVRIIRQAIR
jgi:hypothetical protein